MNGRIPLRVPYGSPLEKALLSGGFLLASAACFLLLRIAGILLSPFLGLAVYLATSGLLLALFPLEALARWAFGRLVYRFLPALLLAGGICIASSLPMGPNSSLTVPDYLLHGLEFAALGFLVIRMLHPGFQEALRPSAFVLAFLLSLLFGGLDELRQGFVPGRDPSLVDLASDTAGILVGLLIYRNLYSPSTGPAAQRRAAPGS